ncbi:leucine-rich repeat receptor-like protein kinase PEPR2 [Gossypium australe]|uniref:Leucine-rich repeat receptor-like protein kinase PEPR2 n=1 Tax=Gossypium australe TaxID=47621 RepID=A0A5B6WVR8_9ROSI|nr:leucine-rich repeat receptor-like protein kinase PEPR2 [Gossypium australe]
MGRSITQSGNKQAGVSWKDKLLRGKADGPSLNFGITNEEDLVFVEGDILRSTVNGIPTINFSDRIKDWLVKDMETTVVVKLLGRNMSYGVLHNRISNS